ncbi:MAG: sulfatase [Planctomycetota bacterium]
MASNPERPNVMLLVGEDTGLHLGCYDAFAERCGTTPNLDRLAAEGRRYTHGFSTAPVCAPSRSCLVSGRYAWSTGAHHMRSRLLEPPPTFPEALREAGYCTAWPTKLDFNFDPADGWVDSTDEWIAALRDGSLTRDGRPFFVYKNFAVTHESAVWDTCSHHGGHAELTAALPDERRHDPSAVDVPPYLPDTPEVRRDLARYYDCLATQDLQVGEALDALEASGLADDTLVIYLTDHGRGLPREKRWPYDAGIRLPLIVRWPGRVQAGEVSDALVSWPDVSAALREVCGASALDDAPGRDFLSASATPREFVFAGRDRMDEAYDRVRVARSRRFLYMRHDEPGLPYMCTLKYMEQGPSCRALREAGRRGELHPAAQAFLGERKIAAEEFYDCDADPHQLHNLADDPAYTETLAKHRAALDAELAKYGDLAEHTEYELIERGVVDDWHLKQSFERVATHDEAIRVAAPRTLCTKEQADAYTGRADLV